MNESFLEPHLEPTFGILYGDITKDQLFVQAGQAAVAHTVDPVSKLLIFESASSLLLALARAKGDTPAILEHNCHARKHTKGSFGTRTRKLNTRYRSKTCHVCNVEALLVRTGCWHTLLR